MLKIIKKHSLAKNIKEMIIEAPDIAFNAKPGQFVVIIVKEKGERIPLTISEVDKKNKTITIIFQEVGFTTRLLGTLNEGESIQHILGPLGKGTNLEKLGRVVCIGGGVGIAEIYPVSKAFKECGNEVIGVIGARTKELVILENKMRSICDKLYITTDDGSYMQKGFVTDVLKDLLRQYNLNIALVYLAGPVEMMATAAEITRGFGVKTIVSLNPIMVDATGMCGSCRVTIGGEVKFACVDGPEFDAHKVDFKELRERLNFFKEEENCINSSCPLK